MGIAVPRRYSKQFLQSLSGQPGLVNGRPWGHGALVPPNVSAQNQVNQYGPFPDLYGEFQYFPPYVGVPYTEYVGQIAYTRALYCMGYGPMDLDEFWLGNKQILPTGLSDTTIGTDGGKDIEIEVRYGFPGETPMTLYPSVVVPDNAVKSGITNTFMFRQTTIPADEVTIGILFPNGLYQSLTTDTNSPIDTYIAAYEVDYATTDGSGSPTSGWTSTPGLVVFAYSKFPYQAGLRIKFPARSLYIIRLKRTVASGVSGGLIVDQSDWQYMNSMQVVDPTPPLLNAGGSPIGLCKIAIRAKVVHDQARTLDNFSIIGRRYLPVWTGSAWTLETTNSPVWAYVNAYAGPQNKKAIAYTKFNTTDLVAWDTKCSALGLQYNDVIDSQQTAYQTAQQMCLAGRATPIYQNGKYTAFHDNTRTTPTQLFTPRNTTNFTMQKNFVKLPEAIRAQWANPDILYQQDELLVFAPGYNDDGSGGQTEATNYDTYQLKGVTNPIQVYTLGSYYLDVGLYRQRIITFDTDWEFLPCGVGDLVSVSHELLCSDVTKMPTSGYITAIQTDGSGNVTGFTTDNTVTGDGVTQMSVVIRQADNSQYTGTLAIFSGATNVFTLSTPISHTANPLPVAGNLCSIGAVPIQACVITKMETKQTPQLTCTITCVDYNAAMFASDGQPLPQSFISQQTINPLELNRAVAVPVIVSIDSDSKVMVSDSSGTPQPRILITLTAGDHTVAYYEGGWSVSGSNSPPTPIPSTPATLGQISLQPVTVGQSYDISIRSVSNLGVPSDFTTIEGYTVVGNTDAPEDVHAISEQDGIVSWQDYRPSSLLAGYRLKYLSGSDPNWAAGQLVSNTLIQAQSFDVSNLLAGTVTFMVKAVDATGNESLDAAFVVTDIGDPVLANVVVTEDFVAAGFPGAITNGTKTGGVLKATTASLFWAAASSRFWDTPSTALFWTAVFNTISYTFSFSVASNELPARLTLPVTVTGANYTILYTEITFSNLFWGSGSALFWGTPTSGLFWKGTTVAANQPWPAQGVQADAATYQWTISTAGGNGQGIISAAEAVLDVVDVKEKLSKIAISASGTRLPITQTYRVIEVVNGNISGIGTGGGLTFCTRDYQTTIGSGPLVQVVNASGTGVAVTADIIVEGF